ncbi:hypothetical protein VPHF86_0157 [Vibrio phage F86]
MNDDVRLLELSATGYHSNSTETHTMWVTQDFIDKYGDCILAQTIYFHELDGKHSETEGEISFHSDLQAMALAWADSRGESYKIEEVFDHLRGDYVGEFEDGLNDAIAEMTELNTDLNETIEVTNITKVTIGTETVIV